MARQAASAAAAQSAAGGGACMCEGPRGCISHASITRRSVATHLGEALVARIEARDIAKRLARAQLPHQGGRELHHGLAVIEKQYHECMQGRK